MTKITPGISDIQTVFVFLGSYLSEADNYAES